MFARVRPKFQLFITVLVPKDFSVEGNAPKGVLLQSLRAISGSFLSDAIDGLATLQQGKADLS